MEHRGIYKYTNCKCETLLDVSATTGDHTGGTATCSKKAVCTLCGGTYGDLKPHEYVTRAAQAANCTEAGWNEYEACKNCGDKKNM